MASMLVKWGHSAAFHRDLDSNVSDVVISEPINTHAHAADSTQKILVSVFSNMKNTFSCLIDILKWAVRDKLEEAMEGDRYQGLEENVEVIHAANASLR